MCLKRKPFCSPRSAHSARLRHVDTMPGRPARAPPLSQLSSRPAVSRQAWPCALRAGAGEGKVRPPCLRVVDKITGAGTAELPGRGQQPCPAERWRGALLPLPSLWWPEGQPSPPHLMSRDGRVLRGAPTAGGPLRQAPHPVSRGSSSSPLTGGCPCSALCLRPNLLTPAARSQEVLSVTLIPDGESGLLLHAGLGRPVCEPDIFPSLGGSSVKCKR